MHLRSRIFYYYCYYYYYKCYLGGPWKICISLSLSWLNSTRLIFLDTVLSNCIIVCAKQNKTKQKNNNNKINKQNKTNQIKTKQNKTKQNKTEQNKTKQKYYKKTEQKNEDRTKQQNKTKQNKKNISHVVSLAKILFWGRNTLPLSPTWTHVQT